MDLTGEYVIPAPRQRVWEALNDPAILKECIPGCQEIEKVSDTEFTAKVGLAVGPVRANFNGRVTLSEIDPPNGYKISGEGQGGVAGFGRGSAVVRLVDDPAGTKLTYSADASVGGKLAQIGSRLVEATSRKLAEEFFGRFAEKVGGEPAAEPLSAAEIAAGATPESGASPASPTAATPSRARLSPTIWIPALVAVVLLIMWLARG
jgi:carbon monoxide dehydrogenase subunit G